MKENPDRRRNGIEQRALATLQRYEAVSGRTVGLPVPVDHIAESLGFTIDFDWLVDYNQAYADVQALVFVSQRRILLNYELGRMGNTGQCSFSIAHEIGHYELHSEGLQLDLIRYPVRNPRRADPSRRRGSTQDLEQLTLFEAEQQQLLAPPACRAELNGQNARTPNERDADAFAAALLMPLHFVRQAWLAEFGSMTPIFCIWSHPHTQRVLGLTSPRSAAKIAYAVAKRLTPTFGVSVQAMRYRLERMRLLVWPR